MLASRVPGLESGERGDHGGFLFACFFFFFVGAFGSGPVI